MKYFYASETEYTKVIPLTGSSILVTDDPIMALLKAIRLKHIPLTFIDIDQTMMLERLPPIKKTISNIFAIELTQSSLKLLEKKAFLYIFESDPLEQDDWFYFPKHEFEMRKAIKILFKTEIKNVYNAVKDSVTFITHDMLNDFIRIQIPAHKSILVTRELYHGSPVDITDAYVKPMDDGHEKIPLVYAVKHKAAALKFAVRGAAMAIIWNYTNNYVWLLETYPKIFDGLKQSGYLYTIDGAKFIEEKYPVFTSPKKAKILKKKFIKNVYREIKKQRGTVLIDNKKFQRFLLSCVK